MDDCKNKIVDGIKPEKCTNEDFKDLINMMANISSEEPPISRDGRYLDVDVRLNGEWFYDVAEFYRE